MIKLVTSSTFILMALTFICFCANAQGPADNQSETIVVLETNQGNMEIKLFSDVAPKTCENFIGLVKKGYYDGIIFHRVIKGFMIQG